MLFNCLYLLAMLVASPWLLYRSWKTGRYRDGWSEKWLGKVMPLDVSRQDRHDTDPPVFWLHAVSVGEVQVLRTLIQSILKNWPNAKIAISTTTSTGMELAQKAYSEHHVFYMPFDFTWSVREACRRIRPDWIILAELEIWPNLITQATSMGCQLAVVNGRLSENSFLGYRKLKWLLQATFRRLAFVGAQDSAYAQRFVSMGVIPDRVHVTGSLKFDGASIRRDHVEIQTRRQQLGLRENAMVWVAGSTQYPEEQLIIDTFRAIRSIDRFHQLRLILVPRHPERGDEVFKLMESTLFRSIQRSKVRIEVSPHDSISADSLSSAPSSLLPPNDDWDILLADTIGELRWWWGLATIAFVGGSFGTRGGQNMIEPVAYGVATSVGPNTRNFRDIMRIFLEAEAITILKSPNDLSSWVIEMLDSPDLRTDMGQRGSNVAAHHRGATERTVALLKRYHEHYSIFNKL